MEVKIDTKEKFHVITLIEPNLSANITAKLSITAEKFLGSEVKNVVLKLPNTTSITEDAAEELSRLQNKFYESSASFVICEVQPPVEDQLEQWDLLEMLNITPTESEAWDIVQMEEIERELMESDDVEFNSHGEE